MSSSSAVHFFPFWMLSSVRVKLNQDEVFCLSRKGLSELQLLSCLGPLAQNDLRARYCDRIFCADAPRGAVCAAQIGKEACKEFWRHTEQKGFYTRLLSEPSAVLHEHGVDSNCADQIVSAPFDTSGVTADPALNIPCPISEGVLYDVCEFFRGSGNWTQAHVDFGLTCHDGFDIDSRRLRVGDLQDAAQCFMSWLVSL